MLEFEQKLLDFLDTVCNNTCPQNVIEAMAKDIGDSVAEKVKNALLKQSTEYQLRMSGIGKDLRQQLLAKKHGREAMTPNFLMRVLYGHLYEAVFTTLMKYAGIKFTLSEKIELIIDDNITIPGELDLILELDGRIWDVKTASPNAFEYKFIDWRSLEDKDEFGYFGQAFGYSEATGVPFGGWIVIDKSSGMWKCIEIPQDEHKRLREKYVSQITEKAKHITYRPDDIPPCSGVEDELWKGKKTGKKILGKQCTWCPYKDGICHKKVVRKECEHSQAKNKPVKFYVED